MFSLVTEKSTEIGPFTPEGNNFWRELYLIILGLSISERSDYKLIPEANEKKNSRVEIRY